jgi:metal-responsive CopG/Arc/MetJ family transcriptional regulator
VKTAISVPDETFEEVERRAADLGISRSEFYTTAVREYLKRLDEASLTQQINASIDLVGEDGSGRDAVAAGKRWLASREDDW